jgi:hypothetical protein
VQEAAPVRVVDGPCHDGQEPRGCPGVVGKAGRVLGQVAALDELHGKVGAALGLAHFVNRHDIRMVQGRHGFRLQAEPLALLGRGELTRPKHL